MRSNRAISRQSTKNRHNLSEYEIPPVHNTQHYASHQETDESFEDAENNTYVF